MRLFEILKKTDKEWPPKKCPICGAKIGKGGRDWRGAGVCDKHVYEGYKEKFKPGMDPFAFSPLSRKELERYIGDQARGLSEVTFAEWFNEAFSDKFEDFQVDNQTFDALTGHAWYWAQHGSWPPSNWKWWS